jgi:hypothetical protein
MPQTRKGRKDIENSGYYRLLASCERDEIALELASILSGCQSKVISNGNMLDGSILPDVKYNPNNVKHKLKSTFLDLENCLGHYSHFAVMKADCNSINKTCIQLDYLVITADMVEIYEIKDGDNFDTKKSEGEVESLEKAKQYFGNLFPRKSVTTHVVLWNAKDVSKTSFKVRNLPNDFIVRGTDFCSKYKIDFDAISAYRMSLAENNKNELIKMLQDVISLINTL